MILLYDFLFAVFLIFFSSLASPMKGRGWIVRVASLLIILIFVWDSIQSGSLLLGSLGILVSLMLLSWLLATLNRYAYQNYGPILRVLRIHHPWSLTDDDLVKEIDGYVIPNNKGLYVQKFPSGTVIATYHEAFSKESSISILFPDERMKNKRVSVVVTDIPENLHAGKILVVIDKPFTILYTIFESSKVQFVIQS